MGYRLVIAFLFSVGTVVFLAAAIRGKRHEVMAPVPAAELRTGDLVFQSSHSQQSTWIERATNSPYSHVGLIEVTDSGPIVIEAIGPVTRTPWEKWWKRGRQHRVTILRVRDLSEDDARAAVTAAETFLGRPYDAQFDLDDEKIYCSELVEKAFDQGAHVTLGHLQRLGSLQLQGMEEALHERFGTNIPLDRELITPASLAADPRLGRIWSSFP